MNKPKEKPPLITCPKCAGTGEVILSPEHFETLSAVRLLGEATTDKLTYQLKLQPGNTAINARLENLRTLGLVDRKKDNANLRVWIYFAKK